MKAVILAGGSGERFWPLSTPKKPKQFLDIFGKGSLIRLCRERLDGFVKPEDVFVVTSADLVRETVRELPEVPRANVVGEPMRRDTGAAVALGVGIAAGAGDDVVGFFPSDQLITDVKAFRKALKAAVTIAKKRDAVVTLGIKPTKPATRFGYVNPKTGRFVEKPDLEKAKTYLRKGYLWNAGMFIARVSVFRAAFDRFAPALADSLARIGSCRPSSLKRLYSGLDRISFDYAVMEKLSAAGGVAVVPCDCGWDDVGSYSAFDRYFDHDSRGNVNVGGNRIVESDGNIVIGKSAKISLFGVKNLVVVATGDGFLVADKSRVGEMKKLFQVG